MDVSMIDSDEMSHSSPRTSFFAKNLGIAELIGDLSRQPSIRLESAQLWILSTTKIIGDPGQ